MSTITADAPERDEITTRVLAEMPGRATAAASTAKPSRQRAKAKPAARNGQARKPKAAPKPKPAAKKAAKYPAWVPDAVTRSRVISGNKPGSGGDKTLSYPGPKQHILIRERVLEMLDVAPTHVHDTPAEAWGVTPDAILKLTGVPSFKRLREIATWSADRSEMKPMRPLSRACNDGTGWSTGRYLASTLVAWIDQIKANS